MLIEVEDEVEECDGSIYSYLYEQADEEGMPFIPDDIHEAVHKTFCENCGSECPAKLDCEPEDRWYYCENCDRKIMFWIE